MNRLLVQQQADFFTRQDGSNVDVIIFAQRFNNSQNMLCRFLVAYAGIKCGDIVMFDKEDFLGNLMRETNLLFGERVQKSSGLRIQEKLK